MSTFQILFLFGAVLSFGAMAAIVFYLSRQSLDAQTDESNPPLVSLSEILATGIITAATDLIFIFQRVASTIYLLLLHLGRHLASFVKIIFHQTENYLARLIETMNGRNHRTASKDRRGAVSFFLEQIKIDKRH